MDHTKQGPRTSTQPCLLIAAGAFLLIASSAVAARAQPANWGADREHPPAARTAERSPWDEDWSLTANGGAGAPTGLLGVELERRIAAWLSLRAGAGYGASGVQGAAMMHLHLPSNRTVSLGAGISGGPFQPFELWPIDLCLWEPCDSPGYARWDLAFWNNYELSFEFRGKTAWLFRGFAGTAWLLNPDSFTCVSCDAGEQPDVPHVLLYLGFAVGRAFS